MSSDWRDGETFHDRLKRFVLAAHAAGDRIEGRWYLANVESLIPTLVVVVERVDDPARGAESDGAGGDVKPRLQSFLLAEYADGTEIEGEWWLRYTAPELPEWRVEIATVDADVLSPAEQYSPEP